MKYDKDLFKKIDKHDIGWIYAVKTGEYLKLGSSVLPEQRLQLIKTDNPLKVEVLCLKKVVLMKESERLMHEYIKENTNLHVRGEWYYWNESLEAYIVSVLEALMEHNAKEIEEEELTDIFAEKL